MKATQDRLANLDIANQSLIQAIERHETEKAKILEDIQEAEEEIAKLQDVLDNLKQALEGRSKELTTVKKANAEATKVLDQALKDIASKVCLPTHRLSSK